MIGRAVAACAFAVALAAPGVARARPSEAESLFSQAKQLRDKGQTAEACSKFARSQQLSEGVGVTLYLADCYERLGRTASAWTEFGIAEKLARERNDDRASTAHARGQALEAKLNRITIAFSIVTAPKGSEVRLDGQIVPVEGWNVALAVDPGDHVVTISVPGSGPRTFTARVDAENPHAVVRTDAAAASGSQPGVAQAQPAAAGEDAEALFNEGKRLRDGGQVADACTKFARSQQLAPGVGVTLYLADCYERLGRTASAWTEFTIAERIAREHDDKRADIAHARAQALEPKLDRLTIAVAAGAVPAAGEVELDGQAVSREVWNTALAVDPGDHVVTLTVPGRSPRLFSAHVDTSTPLATVRIDDSSANSSSPPGAASPASGSPSPSDTKAPDPAAGRRWAGIGLLGVGAVAVGVGAGLLTVKNQSMTNGGANGSPSQDNGAAVGSTVAFAVGGAALVSAVVLYLAAPRAKDSALVITPAPLVGGGGAFLRASF